MKPLHAHSLYLRLFGFVLIPYAVKCAGHSSLQDVELLVNCTFDVDICNWQHSNKDDFDWTLISGGTPTGGTGPINDHTQGTSKGKYMFIETSAPRKENEKAQLVSPLIDTWNSNFICFSLWYYAYGQDIGGLRILLRQTQFMNRSEVLWTNTFQGPAWAQTSSTIVPTGPFKIIIEGHVGDGFLGDIAIDDVTISEGKCFTNKEAASKKRQKWNDVMNDEWQYMFLSLAGWLGAAAVFVWLWVLLSIYK